MFKPGDRVQLRDSQGMSGVSPLPNTGDIAIVDGLEPDGDAIRVTFKTGDRKDLSTVLFGRRFELVREEPVAKTVELTPEWIERVASDVSKYLRDSGRPAPVDKAIRLVLNREASEFYEKKFTVSLQLPVYLNVGKEAVRTHLTGKSQFLPDITVTVEEITE